MAKSKAKAKSVRSRKGKRKTRQRSPLRRLVFWLFRWPLRVFAYGLAAAILWVGAYTVINPPGGYYLASEWVRLDKFEHEWRDLDQMSPDLARSVMAAEDANFCDHWGFDIKAIEKAIAANAKGRRVRGASTISQQVAKNVFLWHGRSWLRKGMEAGFTVLIEAIWTKRRIVEVYLNIAEFGEGVFGAQAAARHYYKRDASALTLTQSARLAAVLPDPKRRNPRAGTAYMNRRAAAIVEGARTLEGEGRAECVE
jgi:monofunctional biosynthetic peptidoglycan transglycosylase